MNCPVCGNHEVQSDVDLCHDCKNKRALEQIHQKLMEIEEIFDDNWLNENMPDISEIRSDAQQLTSDVQTIIDEYEETE